MPTPEEVQSQVLDEIKNIGSDFKTQQEQLNKEYKELKHDLESGRKATEDKLQNYQEAILTRQEKLDTEFAKIQAKNEEIVKAQEQIELSLKRPGKNGDSGIIVDPKEVKAFYHAQISNRKEGRVSRSQMRDFKYDEEAYVNYKNAFTEMLHSGAELKHGADQNLIKALSVGVDPDGGYVVPPEISSRMIQRIYEMDPIRQLANVENISSDSLEIPSDWDEFDAGWVNETGTRSETDTAKLGKEKIYAHEMYAKPRATQQLLEDASINIEAWITNKVGKRFARLEGAAFVSGDGIEKPRGFLTYDDGTSKGQVEQIAMGAAAALTADGFVNVKYAMIEDYLERGTWLMNRSTLAAAMLLKDGTGAYIWKPSMIASDPSSTILGAPVRMSTTMPAVAANALSVVYADFREAYTIVDRIGISILRDPYSAKPFVEFYTRRRVGGKVVNWQAIKIGKISA